MDPLTPPDPHREINRLRGGWAGPDPAAVGVPVSTVADDVWDRRVGIGAVVAMVVGAVGPWTSALGLVSKNGVEGDGQIVIVLAAIAAIAGWRYLGRGGHGALISVAVCGLLSSATTIYDTQEILSGSELVSIEWGLMLALAGSLALTGVAARALLVRG
jgi:hypothetical protein